MEILSKPSELQHSSSGNECLRSYAKSKVDQRERRLNETNHQLPAAIQATQDKISGSVKLHRPQILIDQDHLMKVNQFRSRDILK